MSFPFTRARDRDINHFRNFALHNYVLYNTVPCVYTNTFLRRTVRCVKAFTDGLGDNSPIIRFRLQQVLPVLRAERSRRRRRRRNVFRTSLIRQQERYTRAFVMTIKIIIILLLFLLLQLLFISNYALRKVSSVVETCCHPRARPTAIKVIAK